MRNKQSSCHPSFSLENVKGSSNYKINKNTSSLKPACQFGAMTFICLFPFSTFAECTPTPDCASIGYTQTSCEGSSIKCPFDITKLYCTPCDSAFKYDCSSSEFIGSVGTSCGGKYASCQCADNKSFINGRCLRNCSVGMIYYSDNSCSLELDNSKTAIGIVIKDNELIVSANLSKMYWSSTKTDVDSLDNMEEDINPTTLFDGILQTSIIVETFTSDSTSNNAAIYCNSYSSEGSNSGDWYLPAIGELYNYVYNNYTILSSIWNTLGTSIPSRYFWSSSEFNSNYAYSIYMPDGEVMSFYKPNSYSVACLKSIN